MAACDNIYGNEDQWVELHDFLKENKPEYLRNMREKPEKEDICRVCYVADIQGWLWENCDIPWVKEELRGNFEVQRVILGKPHHMDN